MAIQIARRTGNDDGVIITVPAADGSKVTVQSVYNAIRDFEALSQNMDMRPLCQPKTSGKADLGDGNRTGITLVLINKTCLEFEARAGPAVIACRVAGGNTSAANIWEGTATSVHVGTQLTDSAATFASWGIQTGDTIRNVPDGSTATVTTVDSETQITHSALTGGAENDWDIGEAYEIDTTHPICPTANTHVTIAQDASAVDVLETVSSTENLIAALFAAVLARRVL
jgi:hypothetical protein